MCRSYIPTIFRLILYSYPMRLLTLVCIVLSYYFVLPCTGAQPDGIDLFVKACQNRGTNSTLLRSFYVEFERTYYTPKKSQDDLEKLARQYVAEIREQLGDDHPRIRQMTDIPATIESLNMQFNNPREERFRLLYRADDVSRRLWSVAIDKKVDGRWEQKSEFIGDYKGYKNHESAFLISDMSRVDVGNLSGSFEDIVNMGRLQGKMLPIVEAFFMMGTDLAKYEFAQANIDKFRQETEKQRTTGKVSPFILIGQTEYDREGSNAYVVESKQNGVIAERYWIDASRGYICPLVQYFDDKGKIVQEFKSSDYFLEERSGLWFPAQFSEFTAAQKGEPEERFDYRINPTTLRANFPVADEEFCINVRENLRVADQRYSRDGKGISYKAFENGTLSLAKGGLDLDKMTWLVNEGELEMKGSDGRFYRIVRAVFMSVGIILILFGLYRLWMRRKQNHLLILLCVLPIINGCGGSPTVETQNFVTVSPAVLDFGQVRYTDSPVTISFSIVNNGKESVRISDIYSGCGCTVAEISREPIQPGESIHGSVKVDLRGRKGDFDNKLFIAFQGCANILVNITGKIVNDVWFNGRSIRQTAKIGQEKVSVPFSLYTVDHPNIILKLSDAGDTFSLREVSRQKHEEETVITYSLDVVVHNAEFFSKLIILEDENSIVTPIAIPFYCYREREKIAPTISTTRISLGVLQGSAAKYVKIFGDNEVCSAIRGVSVRNIPDSIDIEMVQNEAQSNQRDFVTVVISAGENSVSGFFDGSVCLSFFDGREHFIPINGEIRNK